MLSPRQLYLLRIKKNITDQELSEMLGISINDILIYEYCYKPIPQELYERWEKIVL